MVNTIIPLTEWTTNTVIVHLESSLLLGVFSIADFEVIVEILGTQVIYFLIVCYRLIIYYTYMDILRVKQLPCEGKICTYVHGNTVIMKYNISGNTVIGFTTVTTLNLLL